jgi:hypothetical protein
MDVIKLNICVALLCCIFAACSNNDEEKWEPEVSVSLALFEIDISQYEPIGNTISDATVDFFRRLPTEPLKKSSLKRAIASLDSINSAAKDSLSAKILLDMDLFNDPFRPISSDGLLLSLINSFKEHHQFYAINRFAYEIMSEAGGYSDELKSVTDNIFSRIPIAFSESLTITTIDQITSPETTNKIRWIKALTSIQSRLPVNAKILLTMYNANGEVLDDLLRNNDQNGVVMPLPDKTGNKVRIVREYDQKDVQRIVSSMDKLVIEVVSNSLGLTLDHVKDLHNMKIRASVGLTLKMTTNDLVE